MKKSVLFKAINSFVLSLLIFGIATSITECRKKTASELGSNIVERNDGQSSSYEVLLDERTEDTQYQYGENDLSLFDTVSGKKISLGMSKTDVEEITGEPQSVDRNTYIYDGIVIKYDKDIAVLLSVSSGVFPDESGLRYSTLRGVKLGTSAEDFKKAYGSDYSEGTQNTDASTGETVKEASRAIRYFKKDGTKLEYLGSKLTPELKSDDTSSYYLQDFMFSNQTGEIATMRVALYSAATGGLR